MLTMAFSHKISQLYEHPAIRLKAENLIERKMNHLEEEVKYELLGSDSLEAMMGSLDATLNEISG